MCRRNPGKDWNRHGAGAFQSAVQQQHNLQSVVCWLMMLCACSSETLGNDPNLDVCAGARPCKHHQVKTNLQMPSPDS